VGLATAVVLVGLVVPAVRGIGLALDAGVVFAVVLDARRAARNTLNVTRVWPDPLHQQSPAVLAYELVSDTPSEVRLRDPLAPELGPAFEHTHRGAGSVRLESPLLPNRRGEIGVPEMTARVLGPWGLGWAQRRVAEGTTVRVFPQVRHSGEDELWLRGQLLSRASHREQRRANVGEMHALREYVPGDDVRRIHWKATARLRRPVVSEGTWERHRHVVLLLDAGRPMRPLAGDMPRLDRALAAILALLRVALANEDHVTLVLFSREVRKAIPVDRRRLDWRSLFLQLYAEHADTDEPDYKNAAAWVHTHVPRRSLVVLFSSVGDAAAREPLARAMGMLARRHRAVLVDLEDPTLAELVRTPPHDPAGAFAVVSAMRMRTRNEGLAAELRALGVEVVRTGAERMMVAAVQRYLELRSRD
jgi:uncharacterized protein (DUF58 family)